MTPSQPHYNYGAGFAPGSVQLTTNGPGDEKYKACQYDRVPFVGEQSKDQYDVRRTEEETPPFMNPGAVSQGSIPVETPTTLSVENERRRALRFCLVWTPIPIISMVFPLVGHIGICDSSGVVYDFSGSYSVNVDNMAFGKPCIAAIASRFGDRSVMNEPAFITRWDNAIRRAAAEFRTKPHNFFSNNCFHYVARALSLAQHEGYTNWSIWGVWWIIELRGYPVSIWALVKCCVPPILFWGLLAGAIVLAFWAH